MLICSLGLWTLWLVISLRGLVCTSNASDVWIDLKERFNQTDGSRTYNSQQEIVSVTQDVQSMAEYYSRLKALWGEFESVVPSSACNCKRSRDFLLYPQRQKLYHFVMGINDTYAQVRSQILRMFPLTLVNQAYSMIVSEEI